jgi:hypothetical protein
MNLLDSNVFIQAKNLYYAFDICPGFWEWLDSVTGGPDVGTITKVRDEISGGRDQLAVWMTARGGRPWVLDISDAQTQRAFIAVAAHVQAGRWKPAAKAQFLRGADPWLVAKASVSGGTVVTLEEPAPSSLKKVPLPEICDAFGVSTLRTFDFLRANGASFRL